MPKDGASMRAPMMCWIARMTYPIADPCSFGSIPIYLRQGLNHLNRARFSFSAEAQGASTSNHLALGRVAEPQTRIPIRKASGQPEMIDGFRV